MKDLYYKGKIGEGHNFTYHGLSLTTRSLSPQIDSSSQSLVHPYEVRIGVWNRCFSLPHEADFSDLERIAMAGIFSYFKTEKVESEAA